MKLSKIFNKLVFKFLSKLKNRPSYQVQGKLTKDDSTSVGEGANIIVFLGGELKIGKNCYIGRYVELGTSGNLTINDNTSIQDRCIILGDVSIGRYCLLAPNIHISSGKHSYQICPEWLIKDQDEYIQNGKNLDNTSLTSKPVCIEDDCWIGVNVVILRGIKIHKGCIIGANSVVTKDIPPYSVAVGSPARIIKKRLEFIPKKHIKWNRLEDLPYFYSGFRVSQKEIEQFKDYKGLVAESTFVVSLQSSEIVNKLCIVTKAITDSNCYLTYKTQKVQLSTQIRDYTFTIEDQHTYFYDFSIEASINSSEVIVVDSVYLK